MFEAERWRDLGYGPVWLRIATEKWAYSAEIEQLLLQRYPAEEVRKSTDPYWPGCWLPIRLAEGREHDDVVAAAVEQVVTALDALRAYTSRVDPRAAAATAHPA